MKTSHHAPPSLGERIRQAAERIGGKRALATAIGVAESSVHRYVKGENEPTIGVLVAVAGKTGVRLEWLATGEGSMTLSSRIRETTVPDDVAYVPRIRAEVSAGAGRTNDEGAEVENWPLPRVLLRELSVQPEASAIVRVRGDSMEPTLRDGDLALIDTRSSDAYRDGLYVLRVDDQVLVKRLQLITAGRLLVRSDNQAYAPFELGGDREDLIVGRVVWAGKRVG